jgi:hypothetical protein
LPAGTGEGIVFELTFFEALEQPDRPQETLIESLISWAVF